MSGGISDQQIGNETSQHIKNQELQFLTDKKVISVNDQYTSIQIT